MNNIDRATELSQKARDLSLHAQELAQTLTEKMQCTIPPAETMSPFMLGLTVFVLAIFVGYYVVWKVTPALHSPLMSVTNAISSVIVLGALIGAGQIKSHAAQIIGFIAVILASINIFGGFLVTRRMLEMFDGKKKKDTQK